MKTYRLLLTLGTVTFIEAERYEEEGHMIRFYDGESIVAEYARTAVKKLEESSIPMPWKDRKADVVSFLESP